jgi:hypothetical protein
VHLDVSVNTSHPRAQRGKPDASVASLDSRYKVCGLDDHHVAWKLIEETLGRIADEQTLESRS